MVDGEDACRSAEKTALYARRVVLSRGEDRALITLRAQRARPALYIAWGRALTRNDWRHYQDVNRGSAGGSRWRPARAGARPSGPITRGSCRSAARAASPYSTIVRVRAHPWRMPPSFARLPYRDDNSRWPARGGSDIVGFRPGTFGPFSDCVESSSMWRWPGAADRGGPPHGPVSVRSYPSPRVGRAVGRGRALRRLVRRTTARSCASNPTPP